MGYLAGFVDAEGSFSVSVKYQPDLRYKIRVDPVFSITQKERKVLETIQRILGCGRIMPKQGQKNLWVLIVDGLDELYSKLIPALDTLYFICKKQNYEIFRQIVLKLKEKEYSLAYRDVEWLVSMAYQLSEYNSKSQRKRTLAEVLKILSGSLGGKAPGER